MSLAIKETKVEAILLADGWHQVYDFCTDACEFVDEDGAFPHAWGGTGFTATDVDACSMLSGPLSSLLAVRCSA